MPTRSNPFRVQAAIGPGLLVALVVWYAGAVGMLVEFSSRSMVSSGVTLARLLALAPFALAGWVVTRPRIIAGASASPSLGVSVRLGALTGLTGGIGIAVLAAIVDQMGVDVVRGVFVSVSPELLDVLRWGMPALQGAAVFVVLGVVLAVGGAFLRVGHARITRPVIVGVGVVVFGGLLQRILPTAMRELGLESGWLYDRRFGGLTISGAIIVFALGAASVPLRERIPGRRSTSDAPRVPDRRRRLLVGIALIVAAAVLPQLLGSILSRALGTTAIFLLMGLGLNIVVGVAGLLDLGYVAFFAVGAYATAIFTNANLVGALGDTISPAFSLPLNFYVALPLVIIVAMIIGVFIGMPVLRLRGDYLAIVTLGFGEIARVLLTSDWLRGFVGGAQGVRDITDAGFGTFDFRDPQTFTYLALAFVLVGVFVSSRLVESRTGRAWIAMREDEQVAETMGIDTTRYKLLAFSMGAAIGCLSGALFAVQIGSLAPTSFRVLVSIQALALIILGGIGSVRGVVIGALLLVGIPEVLTEFDQFRLLLYGIILMVMMILRPEGIAPPKRRGPTLAIAESGQDKWLTGKAATTEEGA